MHVFDNADENKNGFLQDEELDKEESHGRTFKQMAVMTGTFDTEGNYFGRPNYEEAVQKLWANETTVAFDGADTNKDGHLDATEFIPLYETLNTQAMERLFGDVDADNDGNVTPEEWKAMIYGKRFESGHEAAKVFFSAGW